MAERRPKQGSANDEDTPLARAWANPAVREGFLRSLDAKLRGEKPVRATELIDLLKRHQGREHGGRP